MGQVGFGQRDDGVIQMAYVVADLRAAIKQWTTTLRVGPWFVLEHFTGEDAVYRGQPSAADVALAMSFAGHMNIELIQPNNDAPSVYREWIDRHGHGFHHWGRATTNFDHDVEHYRPPGPAWWLLPSWPDGGPAGIMITTKAFPASLST